MKRLPPFDQRIPDSNYLDTLLNQIRSTSDRIAGETWEEFYERTYQLAQAERRKQIRSRLRTSR